MLINLNHRLHLLILALATLALLAACGETPLKPWDAKILGQIQFNIQDTDPDQGELEGDLNLTGVPPLTGVEQLVVYWGNAKDAAAKGSQFKEIPVASLSNPLLKVAANTSIQGKFFLIFLKAQGKEVFSGVATEVVDLVKPKEEPKPEPVVMAPIEIKIDKVLFEFDRAELTDAFRKQLQDQLSAMQNKESVQLRIDGHADERGSDKYNLDLGQRRALAVKRFLATLGFNPDNIAVNTFGESKPAVSGHNEDAWKQNRRAETNLEK